MTLQAMVDSVSAKVPSVCEFCGKPLTTTSVTIFGETFSGIPCYGSCGCDSSRRMMDAASNTSSGHRTCDMALYGFPIEYQAEYDEAAAYADSVSSGRSLYIYGGNGTGKTSLAVAIAREIFNRGQKARFANSAQALEQIKHEMDARHNQTWSALCECKVLVLDDLGKEHTSDWALSLLYALVEAHYANGNPLIVTSNYSLAQLAAGYGGSTAKAIASRLTEICDFVRMDGADRRLTA